MDDAREPRSHGKWTAEMADVLSRKFRDTGVRVLWDPHRVSHSNAPLAEPGQITASFGAALHRDPLLKHKHDSSPQGSKRFVGHCAARTLHSADTTGRS